MPREREIVVRTRALLQSMGAKVIKTSGEGEPDIVGCLDGFSFVIELKQPGKKPRPLQVQRLKEWERAGSIAFWSDFPAAAAVYLDDEIKKRRNSIYLSVKRTRYEKKTGAERAEPV